ncbi:translation initiation factor IF-2-like [Phyllostomus hastatus]|uniref:translation initiation factor IF-2-like n=1 Tax=Phyllostomus hastatus TaxID=9423 RepID=UPI001E682558|nr:translation initiation factor IF-2-like [Phyllostomus hastatus]
MRIPDRKGPVSFSVSSGEGVPACKSGPGGHCPVSHSLPSPFTGRTFPRLPGCEGNRQALLRRPLLPAQLPTWKELEGCCGFPQGAASGWARCGWAPGPAGGSPVPADRQRPGGTVAEHRGEDASDPEGAPGTTFQSPPDTSPLWHSVRPPERPTGERTSREEAARDVSWAPPPPPRAEAADGVQRSALRCRSPRRPEGGEAWGRRREAQARVSWAPRGRTSGAGGGFPAEPVTRVESELEPCPRRAVHAEGDADVSESEPHGAGGRGGGWPQGFLSTPGNRRQRRLRGGWAGRRHRCVRPRVSWETDPARAPSPP